MGSFAGVRYQRGDGFWGRFISGTVLPLVKKGLPFLGKTAIDAGVGLVNDISKGETFGKSLKNRFKEGAGKVAHALEEKVDQLTGSGKRKRGKSSARQIRKSKRQKPAKKKVRSAKKKKALDFL